MSDTENATNSQSPQPPADGAPAFVNVRVEVQAFHLFCFCLTVFVGGGVVGMQLVGRAPVEWGATVPVAVCAVVSALLLWRTARLSR
ncbi:lipopolysaccharide export LptBFGC system permease protein LptF [Paraburkholderia sp. GAS32]